MVPIVCGTTGDGVLRGRRSAGWPRVIAVLAVLAPQAAVACMDVDEGPVARDTLTVGQCVAEARQQAPTVMAARHLQRAAAGDSAATAFNRRPDVALRAGATIAPDGFYDPTITNLGDYEVKAGIDWTLADGGARARARNRSRLGLASARWRAAIETRDAGLEAARLALRLARLAEARDAQRQNLEWL